jgi:long-chain fatty acid transport protein
LWGVLVWLACGVASGRELGRQPYPLGERAAGMSGAFISLTGDPTSIYYNPAGLAGLTTGGVSISASAYQYAIETYQSAFELELPDGREGGDLSSRQFSTFPSSLVYVKPVADAGDTRHVLAFAVLLPDNDVFEGQMNVSPREYAFAFNLRLAQRDSTYWIGPAYAWQSGPLRLGLSVFGLAHFTSRKFSLGLRFAQVDGAGGQVNFNSTSVADLSALGVTALAQVGIQYALDTHWTIGFTYRSATLGSLYSSGEGLAFNSTLVADQDGESVPDTANVDRIELTDIEVDQRLPAMFGLGLSARYPKWTLALDGTVHLPVNRYARIKGPPGIPIAADGLPVTDEDRFLDPTTFEANTLVWNLNLGAEYTLSPQWLLRAGVFTDHAAVDHAFLSSAELRADAASLPQIDRYGVSLGVGNLNEKSSTSVGLVYSYGSGETFALSELLGAPVERAQVTLHTITAVLAGTADL